MLLEKRVPHSSSVMSFTFLVGTPSSTYTSISAKTRAFSFLRWREKSRVEKVPSRSRGTSGFSAPTLVGKVLGL